MTTGQSFASQVADSHKHFQFCFLNICRFKGTEDAGEESEGESVLHHLGCSGLSVHFKDSTELMKLSESDKLCKSMRVTRHL